MDELISIKQALSFLLEQENIRHQEIQMLHEEIEALNKSLEGRSQEFSRWVDDRDFRDFSGKYAEKLAPYAEKMGKIHDGYDLIRDTYDAYNSSEGDIPEEEFVEDTVKALDSYLADIGIPAGTKVEVKADLNGDGVTETVVDSTETPAESAEAPAEATSTEDIKAAFMEDKDAQKAKEALVATGMSEKKADAEIQKWINESDEAAFMDSINSAVDKELAKK